jgi:endoglucanase
MNQRRLKLLRELLAQPTAPFREQHVAAWAVRQLARAGVPHFFDPAGNLIVGVDSADHYRKRVRRASREPLRLLIAHMDHPGFHGVRWISDRRLAIQWHGGSPTRLLGGARVWLASDGGYVGAGQLAAVRLHKSGHALGSAEVRLPKPLAAKPAATDLFGGFRFRAPVWQSGQKLYTKAADDLVGVFALVNTAIELWRRRRGDAPGSASPGPSRRPPGMAGGRATPGAVAGTRARSAGDASFIGLLSRGEEVGFTGAIAHFELGWLSRAKRPIVCVSLETSRTLPGAVIGRGPVVRLGDRRTVFDAHALKVLSDLAQQALPGKHQRRVMDGGTCEATAATVYGLPAIGVSVPLGNYHNEGYEGGPDAVPGRTRAARDRKSGAAARGSRGPAPEFVHLADVDGLLRLCRVLVSPGLPWRQPWRDVQQRLRKNLRTYRRLLKRPIHAP